MNTSTPVPKRPLGKSGEAVSLVGLGTVKFGRSTGVKYPGTVTIPSDTEAAELLAAAERLGINLLDTAPAYGNSEERLGQLLEGSRDRWFIVTKAGEEWDGERSSFDFSSRAIGESVERSMERLRTKRLDCVLLHSDGLTEQSPDGFELAARAIIHAKQRGEVGLVGASVKTFVGARFAMAWADVLMLEFEDGDSQMESVASECERRGIGILAKKALASGHLNRLGANPVERVMKRVLAIPAVASVVVGTTNLQHLRENCEAATKAADVGQGLSEKGA